MNHSFRPRNSGFCYLLGHSMLAQNWRAVKKSIGCGVILASADGYLSIALNLTTLVVTAGLLTAVLFELGMIGLLDTFFGELTGLLITRHPLVGGFVKDTDAILSVAPGTTTSRLCVLSSVRLRRPRSAQF